MAQEVSRVLIDAVGAGPFEFLLPIASRKKADSKCPGPSGSQHVPDAVADDDAAVDWYIETLRRSDKEVRVRLSMAYEVTGDDRHVWAQLQEFERVPRALQASARRDRMRHLACRQVIQQLLRAGKEAKRGSLPFVHFPMQALDAFCHLLIHRMTDLSKSGVQQ